MRHFYSYLWETKMTKCGKIVFNHDVTRASVDILSKMVFNDDETQFLYIEQNCFQLQTAVFWSNVMTYTRAHKSWLNEFYIGEH